MSDEIDRCSGMTALRRVCLLLLLAGCERLSTGAREDFGRRYSCPDDRVTVKSREDLQADQVLGLRLPEPQPPAEVKSDPGRFAKWQADRAQDRTRMAALNEHYEVFEVSGCGHTDVVACRHPTTPDGRGTYPGRVMCQPSRQPLP